MNAAAERLTAYFWLPMRFESARAAQAERAEAPCTVFLLIYTRKCQNKFNINFNFFAIQHESTSINVIIILEKN